MSSDENTVSAPQSETPPVAPADEPLMRKFEISATKEEIETEVAKLAEKYSHKVKVPGFRQGKVPVDVVRSNFKKTLTDEVIEDLVRRRTFERIEGEKMSIASAPVADKIEYADGGDLKAQVAVEVFPEVTLPEIEGLEVAIPAAMLKMEAFDENQQMERVRQAHERSVPVKDRGVAEGDLALFSLQSRPTDSKKLTPKKDSYFLMKKEGEAEIPGMFVELIDKKINDKITLKRQFPAEHSKKAWAGKEVEFLLEVKNIFELKKPELNEEFLKSIGVATVADLKKRLREEYDHQLEHQREEVIVGQILQRLAEIVQVEVPQSLIQQEIRSRLSRQQAPLRFEGEEDKEKFRNDLLDSARRSVKLSLILDEVRKKYKIEVIDDDLQKEYKHQAMHHGVPEKDIRKYYGEEEKLEQLKSHILDTKVLDFIKSKAKIKEV